MTHVASVLDRDEKRSHPNLRETHKIAAPTEYKSPEKQSVVGLVRFGFIGGRAGIMASLVGLGYRLRSCFRRGPY